jgi:DNA polymerase I-like protein with 3'-5' exonuclease and polymerase domains
VHDEVCIEYPKSMPEVSDKLKEFMEQSASIFCKKLPIPASPKVGDCWIH